MRRFKLLTQIGWPEEFYSCGKIYDDNYPQSLKGVDHEFIHEYASKYPEDWEEVFELESKWISVKERLPEEGGRYWCYVEEVNDLGISHYQWNCSYNEIKKRWSEDKSNIEPCVTHWMPLPNPPAK